MSHLKLSIITVTYKDPEGLSRTLESLKPLSLAHIDFEHIIVDASPNESIPVIEKYLNGWTIRHIRQSPEGIYSAMNLGIKTATGDLVWFLNGGDELASAVTLKAALIIFSEKSDLQLLLCSVERVRDGFATYTINPVSRLRDGLVGANHICHQGLIYRKTIFNSVGAFDTQYVLAADYDHLFKCLLAKVLFKPYGAVLVRFNSGGASEQFHLVVSEFRSIQKKYSDRLGFIFSSQNLFIHCLEHARLEVIEKIRPLAISGVLKKIWYQYKRGLGK